MKLGRSLKVGVVLMGFAAITSTARAGSCVLTIERFPCPGKEKEAFKPYGGKQKTEEKSTVANEAACTAKIEDAAKIQRAGVLSKKTVQGTFDGKALAEKSSTKECK